jgi:hypothetical protein
VTLQEAVDAMVAALQTVQMEMPELQVYGYFNQNPTPPSIDIYPGEPFQDGAGFGVDDKRVFWTVRARASLADQEAGTRLLLRLLDTEDPASVEAALAASDTAVIGADGSVSGFRTYADSGDNTDLLGTEWRVEMFV